MDGNVRFEILDEDHVMDTETGVLLHVYEDWFKLTRDGEVLATMRDFDTTIEQPIVWEIKAYITPAEVLEQRKANYMEDIKRRREALSYKYESPAPIKPDKVLLESNATEYTG